MRATTVCLLVVQHDVTEAALRAIIRGRFAEFIPALDAPHWRAHADAVRARDPEAAASALRKARGGDGRHQIEVLLGSWAHPNPPVSAAWIALVRELDRGSTLFHAFMHGIAWDRRPEIAPSPTRGSTASSRSAARGSR